MSEEMKLLIVMLAHGLVAWFAIKEIIRFVSWATGKVLEEMEKGE